MPIDTTSNMTIMGRIGIGTDGPHGSTSRMCVESGAVSRSRRPLVWTYAFS
jgi:hypothetical protein